MIAALVAQIAGSAAWSIAKRYWKPLLLGAIGISIAATIAVQHWRINSLTAARAQDQMAIAAVVQANAANIAAIDELQRAAAADRRVTADAVRRANAIAAATETIIQEIQRDPHASDLAGPMFDALGDRLRGLDQGRHPDPRRVP